MADNTSKARAGAVNFQRRTWDKEEFEKKAKERLDKDLTGESLKEAQAGTAAPFRAAAPGLKRVEGSERAFVQSRDYDLNLDSKLGKRRLVTESTPQSQVGGYYCDVCACTLRDSATYLDHINGKNHQKRLGFSMRTERSSVDQVKARFDKLKAQKSGGLGAYGEAGRGRAPVLDADDRYAMAAMDAPDIHMVSADKVSKPSSAHVPTANGSAAAFASGASGEGDGPAAKRPRVDEGSAASSSSSSLSANGAPHGGGAPSQGSSNAGIQPPLEDDGIDPEMAAMMGFGGFGGSAKGR